MHIKEWVNDYTSRYAIKATAPQKQPQHKSPLKMELEFYLQHNHVRIISCMVELYLWKFNITTIFGKFLHIWYCNN